MSGVKIDKVFEGTAAHDCGIRAGDRVLEVAKVEITHPIQMFLELSKQKHNGFAEVKVLRDEQVRLHRMQFNVN